MTPTTLVLCNLGLYLASGVVSALAHAIAPEASWVQAVKAAGFDPVAFFAALANMLRPKGQP